MKNPSAVSLRGEEPARLPGVENFVARLPRWPSPCAPPGLPAPTPTRSAQQAQRERYRYPGYRYPYPEQELLLPLPTVRNPALRRSTRAANAPGHCPGTDLPLASHSWAIFPCPMRHLTDRRSSRSKAAKATAFPTLRPRRMIWDVVENPEQSTNGHPTRINSPQLPPPPPKS